MSYVGMGAFDAMKPNCGDTKWLQVSLKSQGYDPGPLDGIWGPQTATTFARYCAEKVGVGAIQAGQCCNALQQAVAGGAALTPTPGQAPPSCPQGTFQSPLPPYSCIQLPWAQQAQPQPQPGQACPPGTMGVPPACLPIPGYQPPPAPPVARRPGMTTNQKLLIGGIVVAAGVVVLGVVLGKKKPRATGTTTARIGPTGTLAMEPARPNRRRRRRTHNWYNEGYNQALRDKAAGLPIVLPALVPATRPMGRIPARSVLVYKRGYTAGAQATDAS